MMKKQKKNTCKIIDFLYEDKIVDEFFELKQNIKEWMDLGSSGGLGLIKSKIKSPKKEKKAKK